MTTAMSTESAFSPLSFPALPGQGGGERDAIRGHATGYAAGRKRADAELESLRASLRAEAEHAAELSRERVGTALEALARAAEDYSSRLAPALQSVDASLAAAAMELAEAIVGHELSTSAGSARAALEHATGSDIPAGAVVRLNPQDVQLILAEGAPQPGLDLVPDFSLQPGDAVVELAHGTLDARVSASLARARAALVEGRA